MLAVNPSSLEAHAMLGAMAYVRDDQAGFDARGRQGARDQSDATARSTASPAEQAASHYRFDEAVALAQKALTLDPTDSPRARAISACT